MARWFTRVVAGGLVTAVFVAGAWRQVRQADRASAAAVALIPPRMLWVNPERDEVRLRRELEQLQRQLDEATMRAAGAGRRGDYPALRPKPIL